MFTYIFLNRRISVLNSLTSSKWSNLLIIGIQNLNEKFMHVIHLDKNLCIRLIDSNHILKTAAPFVNPYDYTIRICVVNPRTILTTKNI